jgi:hypothetical protein
MAASPFRARTSALVAQLPSGASPGPLIDAVEKLGARVHSVEISHEADRRTMLLQVTMPPRLDAPHVIAELGNVDDVLEVRWTD